MPAEDTAAPGAPLVLVVDDDKSIQKLLVDFLQSEGFNAVAEKDGEWALKIFDRREVDCVILDLLIPGLNGFQVAEKIRAHARGGKVPIVMMSGIYKSMQHRAEARAKYGVTDYVEKPFDLDKMAGLLRRIFGDRYPSTEVKQAQEAEKAAIDARPAGELADEGAREEAKAVETEAREIAHKPQVRGKLEQKPFPELLADLYRKRVTGALLLRREKVKKIVYLREGLPVFIKSNLLQECLGRVMVRERMIGEADCEESIRRMKEAGRQQGTILIEMGRISPHNLRYALQLQLQQKLYDVFSWQDGDYQLNESAEAAPSAVELDMTMASMIYEGIKRALPDDRVLGLLGEDAASEYVHPNADPLHRFQEAGLDPDEMEILEQVDGTRTAQEVVEISPLLPGDTWRFLYAMRCAQVLELSPKAAKRSRKPPPPPPSVEVASGDDEKEPEVPTDPGSAPVPRSSGPQSPARTFARKRSGVIPEIPTGDIDVPGMTAEERAVREQLVAQIQSMKKMNYFEILGVPRTAAKEDVKRAYFALAKEYHPDKHYSSASAEVRNLAGEIFALIGAAHDTLVDDEERERYLDDLAHGVKKDVSDEVSRILAAEGKFEKGEELLRNREFGAAYEAFQEAVQIYPDEGEFHAFLGWSRFQSDPKDAKGTQQAMDDIEQAIRLNPKVDKAYLFLGYIFKATGRPDKAEKQFEKAIQCNPDCTEALRELRLLGKQKSR